MASDISCLHVNVSHTPCNLLLFLFDLILGTALAYLAFALSSPWNRIAKSAEIHFLSEYLSYLSHAAIDLNTCLGRESREKLAEMSQESCGHLKWKNELFAALLCRMAIERVSLAASRLTFEVPGGPGAAGWARFTNNV